VQREHTEESRPNEEPQSIEEFLNIVLPSDDIDPKAGGDVEVFLYHTEDGPDKKGKAKERKCVCCEDGYLSRHKTYTTKEKWSTKLLRYLRFVVQYYRCQHCNKVFSAHKLGLLERSSLTADSMVQLVEKHLGEGAKPYRTCKKLNELSPEGPYFEPTRVRRILSRVEKKLTLALSHFQELGKLGFPQWVLAGMEKLASALKERLEKPELAPFVLAAWKAARILSVRASLRGRQARSPPCFDFPPMWL